MIPIKGIDIPIAIMRVVDFFPTEIPAEAFDGDSVGELVVGQSPER